VTDTDVQLLALEVAIAWLNDDPQALDMAHDLGLHAAATGTTTGTVAALLDCLGIALGTAPNIRSARARITKHYDQLMTERLNQQQERR